MRERRYSPEEVQEQVEKLINELKNHADEWRKLPYRYVCLFCGVPLRSAQPILIQLRACQNIEYKYQANAVKIPTVICHYTEEENPITSGRFAQFSEEEFAFLYDKVKEVCDPATDHKKCMLLLIFIEQLVLGGFRDQWQDLSIGFYAVSMGLSDEDIDTMIRQLQQLHILKQLGMSRMFRVALSEEEAQALEDSAYAKQQEEIVERSKRKVKEELPAKTEADFTVLTELNNVAEAAEQMKQYSYEVNESIVKQQLTLRVISDALQALKEKESVYSGMAVRIAAISQNYEEAVTKSQELENKNRQLRQIAAKTDQFYKKRQQLISQELEAMLSSILSIMEEYFALPGYEKNKLTNSNRTKAQITQLVINTITKIQSGKDPDEP